MTQAILALYNLVKRRKGVTTVTGEAKTHTKGAVAPGKKPVSWRLPIGVVNQIDFERKRLGFDSSPAYLAAHFTRWFNTEQGASIQREP